MKSLKIALYSLVIALSATWGYLAFKSPPKAQLEANNNDLIGNSAFTAPSFFKISSSSLTLITSTRDFYIGGGTASSSSNVVFTVDPINDIVSVPSTASFDFYGEIRPDGLTCSNGQILKRTGANDWDCAADASGSVSSNSLDFDEFVDSMTLDADLTINTPSSRKIGIGAAPSTKFEVQGTASASYFLTGNTLQVGGFSSAAYSRFGTDVTTNSNYISTTNDVLVSGDLQVIGTGSFNYASTSLGYFGGGLTDCDGGTSKLLWSDTGLFSCGTDDDVPESGDFTNLTGGLAIDNTAGTLDFDSTEFTGNRNWSDGTSDSTFTWTFDLNAGTDIGINFGDNRLLISQNVSTSSNFEAVGYASASKTFGSGLTDCDDPGQTLAWTASGSSNGKFSCQSRAGYTLEFNHANTTPLTDNTNLYFGNTILAATTANNVFFVNVPKAGVVTGAACQELATPGTSEAGILAIQVAGTPAGTISAAVDLSASGNEYTNFAMYIPVNQGDNLSILFDPPTWATNPSNLNINCVVYIEND